MSEWDLSKAIGHKMCNYEVVVDNREMILYALGIGFQRDPMNAADYNFTYENAEDFQSFPTIAVVMAHRQPAMTSVPGMPSFNPMMLLHGEEKLEVYSPIQADTTLSVAESVYDLQDKGKATVMVILSEIKDKETGELKAKIYMTLFIRGIGGFGNKGKYQNPLPNAPKTAPHKSSEEKTDANQAFLYRLCGDRNPLHVDPNMSAMGGFDVPILHGLCTYGINARAVQQAFFKEDPTQLESISGRFTSHVFPGETLIVDMWKEGNKIVFASRTKERGKVVMKGYATVKAGAKM